MVKTNRVMRGRFHPEICISRMGSGDTRGSPIVIALQPVVTNCKFCAGGGFVTNRRMRGTRSLKRCRESANQTIRVACITTAADHNGAPTARAKRAGNLALSRRGGSAGGVEMANCTTVRNPLYTCTLVSLCMLCATAPRTHAQRPERISPITSDTGPRIVSAPQSLSGSVQSPEVQEHLRKELALAADYFVGRGVPRDLTQSVYWYRKAAEAGEPLAQVQLGYFYHIGIGVQRNDTEAARWYQKAAASGSAHGKINLASLYLSGEGVRQSAEVAVNLLRSAARDGDGTAEAYLGVMSYTGVGMKADAHAAEKWFKEGVKHHSAEAEFDLASLYSVHPDHAQDFGKAAKLLRLSAGRGYVPAKHSLGLLLVNHPKLPQAPGEAVSLLGSAAEAG